MTSTDTSIMECAAKGLHISYVQAQSQQGLEDRIASLSGRGIIGVSDRGILYLTERGSRLYDPSVEIPFPKHSLDTL